MNLSEAVSRIFRRDWSYTNTFSIMLSLNGTAFIKENIKLPDDIELNVVSVTMPDLNTEQIDSWTINHNRVIHGAEQEITITVRFIDYDNMYLWRSFIKTYDLSKYNYPADMWLDLSVFKSADSLTTVLFDSDLVPKQHLITYKNCIVKSVGNIDFNNESDAQVAQFNVMFVAQSYSLKDTKQKAAPESRLNLDLSNMKPPIDIDLTIPTNPIPPVTINPTLGDNPANPDNQNTV